MRQRLTRPVPTRDSPVRCKLPAPSWSPCRRRHGGSRSRAAPCTGRTSLPIRPAPAGQLLPLLKRCPTAENFVGKTLPSELSREGSTAFGKGVAGSAKHTSAVLPRSPLQGRSASQEMVTWPQPCAATVQPAFCSPALLTGKLLSRARRAGHGAGPFPISGGREKVCLHLLGSRRSPFI